LNGCAGIDSRSGGVVWPTPESQARGINAAVGGLVGAAAGAAIGAATGNPAAGAAIGGAAGAAIGGTARVHERAPVYPPQYQPPQYQDGGDA
jgi:hypothetical protein